VVFDEREPRKNESRVEPRGRRGGKGARLLGEVAEVREPRLLLLGLRELLRADLVGFGRPGFTL
jgi:hypothetical protein